MAQVAPTPQLLPQYGFSPAAGAGAVMGGPRLPANPNLPAATSSTSTASGPLPNYGPVGVNELFDPNFGRTETQTNAAENALAGGFAGSGYAAGQGAKMLDSERRQNWVTGHQILEPYLAREHDTTENAANRAARLNEIAAQGAQALQQLQLSEAGQTSRLSSELSARLQQQVLDGQQAMQRLQLTEAGAASRQRTGIGGDIAQTILQSALQRSSSGGGAPSRAPIPYTHYDEGMRLGTYADSPAPVGGGGSRISSSILNTSSIDNILRSYGLLR